MRLSIEGIRQLLELPGSLSLALPNDTLHLPTGLIESVAAPLILVHSRRAGLHVGACRDLSRELGRQFNIPDFLARGMMMIRVIPCCRRGLDVP